MKRIPLTQGKVALVDDEDYDIISKFKWMVWINKRCNNVYARRSPKGKTIVMHRIVLGLTNTDIKVDHIDKDGLNNQKSNLRIATTSQNAANRRSKKNSTSKYLGVSWSKNANKWIVHIRDNGIRRHLGLFEDEKQAAVVYNIAAIKVHGDFASLNKT